MNQDELKVLEERIKANPKSRSFLQLAEAYIEMGRRSEALALLKNGEEYYPYYLAARIAYGKLLREERDLDGSIGQFEFVNRTIPENLIALKNLAELYLLKDRFQEAVEMANAALALSPSDPEMTEVLNKAQAGIGSKSSRVASPAPSSVKSPPPPEKPPAPVPEPSLEEDVVYVHINEGQETLSAPEADPPVVEPPLKARKPPEPEPAAPSNLPRTETMGDLLVGQGHLEEALSVYESVLAQDPRSATLPKKIHTLKTTLGLLKSPEPSPQIEEEVMTVVIEEEDAGEKEAVDAALSSLEVMSSSPVLTGLSDRIVDKIRDRMGRELIGYVISTLDGLSAEASDKGHWADVLAAEGVAIVRAVTDMTHMLNWGELQGTVVWMDKAVLYGLPVQRNEALFLALKSGANVGLCRLLVAQVIEDMRLQETQE